METFMERIIETDRRARAVIEQALAKRETELAKARAEAEAEAEQRSASMRAEMEEIDRSAEAWKAKDAEAAESEYLAAKHALDAAFEEKREGWLNKLFERTIGA